MKAGNGLSSAATNWEERLQCLLIQGTRAISPFPLCSCGFGHKTAKHIIIHSRNYSAARHALRDNQGHPPDYKQLVTTPTGLKKVTRCVIVRGMLGQYQRARGLLYPPGPPSPASD
jgi:hypothetical protein